MSKSLTINVPQIVQTRNTLNAVPSGSTAETDNNVKYVPQTLTDAQKAQARENIGAAAAGETGGATINEFHYLRDTTTDPVSYYIDADGYEPQEGDLITIVWDWPFRTNENDPDAAFKNPATLKNNSTNPSIYVKNAHQMATDYDEIDPAVNTRWTVRLEKVDNVWYAYNISTAVQPDWNTSDSTMPSYIKNKPAVTPDFSQMSYILFYQSAEGTTGFVNRITSWQNKDIFSDGEEVYLDYNTKVTSANELRDTVVTAGTHIIHYTATGYSPAVGNWDKLLMEKYGPKVDYLNYYSGQGVLMIQSPYQNRTSNIYAQANFGLVETAGLTHPVGARYIYITTQKPMVNIGIKGTNPSQNYCRSLFVSKGSGLRWRLKNKAIEHIYEYDSITIPEYGASFAPASSNFKAGLPKMTGVKEVIVDLTPYSEPFYFENDTDTAQTITLVTTGTPNAVTFEISNDDGATWTAKTVAEFEQGFNIPAGEKLYIRGETTTYGKDNNNYYTITGGTKIGGNTMSLIYGSDFESKNSLKAAGTFKRLFLNNTTLVDASNLLLPSLVSKNEDYYEMFKGCTALVSAPDVIELDNPADEGFREMFSGCTNLVNAPMLLVSNLKTGSRQYNGATGMFKNCTSLVKAPDLIVDEIGGSDPVTEMFDGCTSLNYIKCTANIHNNISNWVRDVAASGTFITVPGTDWSSGNNGIPSGWTVKYATDYYTDTNL